jgi:hypothetical protein
MMKSELTGFSGKISPNQLRRSLIDMENDRRRRGGFRDKFAWKKGKALTVMERGQGRIPEDKAGGSK